MPRLYTKYIVLYGQDLCLENTIKLMCVLKTLMAARKVVTQILSTIIERNKLVDSLKQIIRLA